MKTIGDKINALADELSTVDIGFHITISQGRYEWECEVSVEGAEPAVVRQGAGCSFATMIAWALQEALWRARKPGMECDDYERDETGNPVG